VALEARASRYPRRIGIAVAAEPMPSQWRRPCAWRVPGLDDITGAIQLCVVGGRPANGWAMGNMSSGHVKLVLTEATH
jgi:hypothetical protein